MCITLSTLNNTYFIFPKENEKIAAGLSAKHMQAPAESEIDYAADARFSFFNPTKIQFATEYLYKLKRNLL